jgi:hypothetical protein
LRFSPEEESMKRVYPLLIAVLLVVMGPKPPVHAMTIAGVTADVGCAGWTNGTGDIYWNRDNTGIGNEQILFEAFDGAGTQIFSFTRQHPLGTISTLTPIYPWDSAPAYNPITLRLRSTAGFGYLEQIYVIDVGNCAGLPTYGEPPIVNPEKPTAVPGCDALIPMPTQARMGQFVMTTPIYWGPGNLVSPIVELEAGKTAWVFGVDASGAYYQILWQCARLWVPVNSMIPANDGVNWLGAPLPTTLAP